MEDIRQLVAGVHPSWITMIRDDKECLNHFTTACNAFVQARSGPILVVPAAENVLEAFRYFSAEDCRVVIVGQDPYHTVERTADGKVHMQAQGLCFSCNRKVGKRQPSLNSIRDAVLVDTAASSGCDVATLKSRINPTTLSAELLDLRFWAAQGVLLLNTSLTTVEGKAGAHIDMWKPFTERLILLLAMKHAKSGTPLHFMVWGGHAKKLVPTLRSIAQTPHAPDTQQPPGEGCGAPSPSPKIVIHEWSHPPTMSDNQQSEAKKFKHCGHFAAVNRALQEHGYPAISWIEPATLIATDGSCPRNGKPDAEAGYGVCVRWGPLRAMDVYGPVKPHEYQLIDSGNPLAGFTPKATSAVPTNNRAEYLAGCYALLFLARSGITCRTLFISDSNNLVRTLNEWLPSRKRKGTAHGLENYDLVQILDVLHQVVMEQTSGRLTLQHIRSHTPEPPPGTPHHTHWTVNNIADGLAAKGRESDKCVVTAPFWTPSCL